jgi:hypothetical protein
MSTDSAWLFIRQELNAGDFIADARQSGCRVAVFDAEQTVAITRELRSGGIASLLRLHVTPDGANGTLGQYARFDISGRDEADFVRQVVGMAHEALEADSEVTHWRGDEVVASHIVGRDSKKILSWSRGLHFGRRGTRREEGLR